MPKNIRHPNIFITGQPLTAFTSGTPMRGLVNALIQLRKDWYFTIEIPRESEYMPHLNKLKKDWKKKNHISIIESHTNKKWGNIKKILGFNRMPVPDNEYDLILSPGVPESFKTSKPVISFVADLSSINMPGSSSLKWHGNRIFRNTLNSAIKTNNKIIAISDFTKVELEERYPNQKQKIITIHNGIEDFWFDNNYEENETTRQLKDQEYWIWWGYMSNRKNLGRLTEAYLKLVNESIKLPKILFIGNIASDQGFLQSTFNQYPEYFIHIPFQKPYILKSLVKNSKGLLFPSLYEGFGLPVIEAYSQGIPVMQSNVTSLPEIGGGLGIEINPHDILSIKAGLYNMANQKLLPGDQEKLKSRASLFTYKKAAGQLADLIEELTNQPGKK